MRENEKVNVTSAEIREYLAEEQNRTTRKRLIRYEGRSGDARFYGSLMKDTVEGGYRFWFKYKKDD